MHFMPVHLLWPLCPNVFLSLYGSLSLLLASCLYFLFLLVILSIARGGAGHYSHLATISSFDVSCSLVSHGRWSNVCYIFCSLPNAGQVMAFVLVVFGWRLSCLNALDRSVRLTWVHLCIFTMWYEPSSVIPTP